ncbi:N-acetyltransferase family protein, partial [bacterium]|nr:N-acetyltransferase family protein [bacterium]
IYNHAIRNSTSLYEYHERTDAVMQEWFAVRVRDETPILGVEWEPGVLAGFATWGPFRLRPAYKYTVEHSVYVAEQFRGRGVGRRLLEAVVAEARSRDLHTLVAGIDASNAASIALHRAVGFTCCGTVYEAGFKFGRWLDLEFWQLVLETPARPVDG